MTFSGFSDFPSQGIIRLQADGTPDRTFQVGFGIQSSFASSPQSYSVYAVAGAPDGVYVGGSFGYANNIASPNLAKFKTDGAVDINFNAGTGGAVGPVNAMWFDPQRGLYIGGPSKYRGVTIGGITRILANGLIDSTFAGQAGFGTGSVRALAPDPTRSDRLYVGGSFTSYQGQTVGNVVRLFANGSLDTSFSATGLFTGSVAALSVVPDGSGVYVGGSISRSVGDDTSYQVGVLRLLPNGQADEAFHYAKPSGPPGYPSYATSGIQGIVYALTAASDGSGVYVGGMISTVNNSTRNGATKLLADGNIDPNFVTGTGFRSIIHALDEQDGRVFAAGNFTAFNGTSVRGFAMLNANGSLHSSTTVGSGVQAYASSILPLNDGSGRTMLIGSLEPMPYIPGKPFGIIRLNADGTNDSTFAPTGLPASMMEVAAMKRDGSGKFYLGGGFTKGLLRANADGTVDTTFAVSGTGFRRNLTYVYDPTQHGDSVNYILENEDGSLFIVGNFGDFNGTASSGLVKLTDSGALDLNFSLGSGFDARVRTAALTRDGSGDLYVGGEFTQYRGTPVRYLARLKANGDLNTEFNAGLSAVTAYMSANPGFVWGLSVAPDNSVFAFGWFDRAFNTPVGNLVKVSGKGVLASGFASSTRLFGSSLVRKIVALPDGGAFVSGDFVTYKGNKAMYVTRIAANADHVPSFSSGSGVGGYITGLSSIRTLSFVNGEVPHMWLSGVFGSYNGLTTGSVLRVDMAGRPD